MPWYRTGTVSVTLNSNAVIGTGTAFVANSRVGDAFLGPDGGWYEVTNIASDSAMSIAPNYRGATNAAGVYALTPVQGYTKDLADQARAMIQQWGATLAGLGTVSTFNVVPVANGGTGGTTPALARSGLQLGSAAVADIVGLTSSGAIMEQGSNANGGYTKFADGTMICTRTVDNTDTVSSAATGMFIGGTFTWIYPQAFYGAPVFAGSAKAPNAVSFLCTNFSSASQASYFNVAAASQASRVYTTWMIAVGRWKA
ncbi:MAG: phage tail protein [Pseudomonas veronii]|nr:phage tail protein [Pseudomonas veronii]